MGVIHRLLGRIRRKVRNGFYCRKIKSVGENVNISKPLYLRGNVIIGDNVTIHEGAWIECYSLTDVPNPVLIVGNGSVIGHFNEIYSTGGVILEQNVLTADRVYISDCSHGYLDTAEPIKSQPIVQRKTVRIGEGSWLGINVCIIGASIGKNCVIGANSVVTKDIPDYCIAVGSPAHIIKRYDVKSKTWRKTNPCGDFE